MFKWRAPLPQGKIGGVNALGEKMPVLVSRASVAASNRRGRSAFDEAAQAVDEGGIGGPRHPRAGGGGRRRRGDAGGQRALVVGDVDPGLGAQPADGLDL